MPQKSSDTGANGAGNAPTKLSKTGAIKAALEAHPGIMPKELAIILKEEGWDVSPQRISVIKSTLKKGAYPAKSKAAPAANAARPAASAPTTKAASVQKTEATPSHKTEATDIVSVALLVRAKKLVQELGGVHEARNVLNALSQLLD